MTRTSRFSQEVRQRAVRSARRKSLDRANGGLRKAGAVEALRVEDLTRRFNAHFPVRERANSSVPRGTAVPTQELPPPFGRDPVLQAPAGVEISLKPLKML
jgi:hypothetical protein